MKCKKIKRLFYRVIGELDVDYIRNRGGIIGNNFKYCRGCILDKSHCWMISIGDNVTFSHNVCVFAHDASTKFYLGYTKIGKVCLGNNIFVGAGTIILPGVTIGDNVIIGAGSVVTKSVPSQTVYAGNPARFICSLDTYIRKESECFERAPKFESEYTVSGGISKKLKKEMLLRLGNSKGYVR